MLYNSRQNGSMLLKEEHTPWVTDIQVTTAKGKTLYGRHNRLPPGADATGNRSL